MGKSRELTLEEIKQIISKVASLMLKFGYNNIDDMVNDLDDLNTLAKAFTQLRPLLSADATAKGVKFVDVRGWQFKEKESGHKEYYDLFMEAMKLVDNKGENK